MFQPQQQRPTIKPQNQTIDYVIHGLLAAIQMTLWLAIVGLESASVYYDAGRGTIYAGFWCSIVFFVTWVSMFCYLCHGQSTGCGMYIIFQNIINLIFVIILIVFTSLFINNPCLCYGILCEIPPQDYITNYLYYEYNEYFGYMCTSRTFQKLPVLKGLLSCAILMLVSNIIFIIAYIITNIWLRAKPLPTSSIQSIEVPIYQLLPMVDSSAEYQQPPMVDSSAEYQQPYLVQTTSEPHYYSSTVGTISTNEIASAPVEMRFDKF